MGERALPPDKDTAALISPEAPAEDSGRGLGVRPLHHHCQAPGEERQEAHAGRSHRQARSAASGQTHEGAEVGKEAENRCR